MSPAHPIDLLQEEHSTLLGALACLEALAMGCMQRQPLEADRAEALVGMIRSFGCGLHHELEGKLLFPLLEGHGLARECGAIGVLTYEHEAFEQALLRLGVAMGEAGEGDPWACRSWARQVDALSHISRGHMAKEEGVLFPFARDVLTPGEERKLRAGMRDLEIESFRGVRERMAAELPEHLAALGVDHVAPLAPRSCSPDPRECPHGGLPQGI